MKNAIKLFVLVAFAIAAMGVSAQTAVKLGHIESQRLIQAMPEWAEAQKKFQAQQDEVEKELTNLQEQFQTKMQDYATNSKTYSDVVRTSKEQELQELRTRIQRFQETAMNELDKTQQDLMQPITEKAMNAIREVAKENGFTYIFDLNAGPILYTSETSLDILPLVKKKLGLQ